MKKIGIILCVLLAGLLTMGAASNIKSYHETYKMKADGTGTVSTQVELTDLGPGIVDVPLTTWKGMQQVSVDGLPAGIQAQPLLKGDIPHLQLIIPQGAPSELNMKIEFDVPAAKGQVKAKPEKEKKLYFRFLNSSQLPVKEYSFKLLLPEGEVVHSVTEQLPKGKAGEGAQVQFIKEEKRQGLVLDAENLKFGETASVRLIAMEDKKSPALLILLGAIAVIYLIVFRDIVKKPVVK